MSKEHNISALKETLYWPTVLIVHQGPQGFTGPPGEPGEPGASVSIPNVSAERLFPTVCPFVVDVELVWKTYAMIRSS